MELKRNTSSFRDPSGYVFIEDNAVKRVVNPIYFEQYTALTDSGFYDTLFDKKYLIRHQEVSKNNSEIIIEASKGKFDLNKVEKVAEEIAKSCFAVCFEKLFKKK